MQTRTKNRFILCCIFALIVFSRMRVHAVEKQPANSSTDKLTPTTFITSANGGTSELLKTARNEIRNAVSHVAPPKLKLKSKSMEKVQDVEYNSADVANETSNKVQNSGARLEKASIFEVNDCLGLGSTISAQLESLLKKDENSSRAQDTRFSIFSRKSRIKNVVLTGEQFGLEWTDFQVHRNTVLIVHGFLSNGNETWIQSMTDAFLSFGDYNVITVDWSDGGYTYNYLKAVVNTQTTGSHIATLFGQIANYTRERGGPSKERWGSIHCVGHSLGAHICGYAANEIKRRGAEWTIHRITGLDPAQPCFRTVDLSLKLDKSDAPFVDVIHTNARIFTDFGLGLPQQLGHIDFYPNGGVLQPGCELTSFRIPILSIPREAINRAICSHGRSYLYFTESINIAVAKNCTFWSQLWNKTYRGIEKILAAGCKNGIYLEMGINSDKYRYLGSFFTLTATSQPFCRSDYWNVEEVKELLKEEFKGTLED